MENHLIIGLGGTGGKIIRSVKSLIHQNQSGEAASGINIDYLYLDTSKDDTQAALNWKHQTDSISLSPSNIVHISNTPLNAYIKNIDAYPTIKTWIGAEDDWSILPVGEVAAGQKRRYGRFLLSCEIDKFITSLNASAQSMIARTTNKLNNITFHVCCGLAGGTGSGTVLDIVAQIRKAYPFDQGNFYNPIYLYTLLPEMTPTTWDQGTYHANGYAALKELNELSFLKYKPYDLADKSKKSLRIGEDGFARNPDVFFNGCYVFTNQNERDVQLKVQDEVPELAGTYIYKKIFSVSNDEARSFINRLARCENGASDPEEDASQPGNPLRGRRFLTFGIKRIGIPEEEIKSYMSAIFAKQASRQLLYNNIVDGHGYTDEPKRNKFNEYVETDENLKRWHLTEQHITLSKLITDADRKRPWKTYVETWEAKKTEFNGIPDIATVKRENWINELKNRYDLYYSETFRGQGVSNFFNLKEKDIKDTADYIYEVIDNDLFELWKKGEFGLVEIGALIADLIASLNRKRMEDLNKKISNLEAKEKEYRGNVDAEDKTWNGTGWFDTWAFKTKKRSFERQNNNLELLYRTRTQLRGYEYSRLLLSELVTRLTEMNGKIDGIRSAISECIADSEKVIDIKCQDAEPRISDHFVKFYDSQAVRQTSKKLSLENEIQRQQTSEFRGKLATMLEGKSSFAQFTKRISKGVLNDLLAEHTGVTVEMINQQLQDKIEGGRRIFNVSITEKIKEQYENNNEELERFIRDLVEQAAVFAKYNDVQENLDPTTSRNKQFIVILPPDAKPEGNNQNSFNHRLKKAFMNSMAGGIPDQNILYTEPRSTEITLLNIHNLFPLRFLTAVQQLKAKYHETVNSPDESIRKRARITLHTEGGDTRFADLFPVELKKENYLPYIVLADALAIIKLEANPTTEIKEYVIAPEDIMGNDIVLGGNLVTDYKKCSFPELDGLKKRILKLLAAEYVAVSKKENLKATITSELELFLASKGNNRRDPEFMLLKEASAEAINLIMN